MSSNGLEKTSMMAGLLYIKKNRGEQLYIKEDKSEYIKYIPGFGFFYENDDFIGSNIEQAIRTLQLLHWTGVRQYYIEYKEILH